jgi:putative NADPH-quinone reductase
MTMNSRRILILNGHPDAGGGHFLDAAVEAYAEAAREGGHEVQRLDVAQLDFPLLRSAHHWQHEAAPPAIMEAQAAIARAQHLAIFYPLWLGGMPALLKGFLEQALRPGFAFDMAGGGWKKRLKGRSARIVVTMGMPAWLYRVYFRAHSLKSLERNILAFVGIRPLRETLIGLVEGSAPRRERWLRRLRDLGRAGN